MEGVSSLYDNSFNLDTVVESFRNKTQSLDEQIYFFTHPGIMNLTFPCTTTLGGTTPGKPCVFPVTYFMGSWGPYFSQKCFKGDIMNTPQPGCFTKVEINNTVDSMRRTDNFWGYCPQECNGELPIPSSPFNLAKSKYANLWSSFFFDLNDWENGLCHTYDPPEKSKTEKLKRAYFMMSYLTEVKDNDYVIFIHEQGQFWPRSGMTPIGQPNSLSLMHNTELNIMFQQKEVHSLSTKKDPCIKKENYSFTQCLQEYVRKETNCEIEFFSKLKDKTPLCKKKEFDLYFHMLTNLKHDPLSDVQKRSGCYPKCKAVHYFYELEKNILTWKTNYTSQVFIEPQSNVVEVASEYYEFDTNDLISSVGGNLGLFLGWSLLSISEKLGVLLTKFYHFCSH